MARQEAVLREALKDAVAAAVRAVPVGRRAVRVVRVVDPETMVPRGPSGRAAPNEPMGLLRGAVIAPRRGPTPERPRAVGSCFFPPAPPFWKRRMNPPAVLL